MAVTHLTDDLDMAGHHIRDWRYLSDIPQGGATTGQVLVWTGTTWEPGTVTGGGGLTSVSWDDVTDKPTEFPPEAHLHVSADVTDWLTTYLITNILGSLSRVEANLGESDDPEVLRAVNPTGMDGSFWFWTTSEVGWHTESPLYIGHSTTANALLVMGHTADNSGEIRIGTSVLTNHSSRGLVVASHAYIGGNFHIVGTSTLVGASTHTGGVITNTVSERTAASGVTLDGVLLKDSEVYTDVVREKTTAAGVTADGVLLKDSEVYTDVVREKTAAAGVTVDGVLLKDNGVTSAWTAVGASKTNVSASQTLTTVGTEFGNTYKLIDASLSVTAASGTIAISTFTLCNLSMTLVSGTPTVFSPTVNVISSTVNAGALNVVVPSGSVQPVHFIFTNPGNAQAFGEGYFSVDVAGTSGDVIAAYTRARVTGSAAGYGYRGYATGASGGTGVIAGVEGYSVIATGAAHTAVMAFSAIILGSAVGIGKRMALRGSDHVLIREGSLILASGTPATPDAVTTTHLTLTAKNSNLYAAGSAEIDGETFMDGNTSCSISAISASANAGTATYIIVDATSGAVTVTLPAASGKAGRMYTVKKIDASANAVTIDGNASETIDGATTQATTTQYTTMRVICNGTNWWMV